MDAGPARAPRPNTTPTCALNDESMPAEWRPSAALAKRLDDAPWSPAEQARADASVRGGLRELTEYFDRHPEQVHVLWNDALEPFLDTSYAASNMPDLQRLATERAQQIFFAQADHYLRRPVESAHCESFSYVLELLLVAHRLWPARPTKQAREAQQGLLDRTHHAFRACGSVEGAVGARFAERLADPKLGNEELYGYVMWSVNLVGARAVPGLNLPDPLWALPEATWRALQRYPFVNASAYPEGAMNSTFYDDAYLATHVSYIPSGYGRYQLYPQDAPWLFKFLRESFYAVLEMGELDLLAEFVDVFRQLGCTEETDRHVRDGARFMLARYEAAGRSWSAHREPGEGPPEPYDLVHKPWTAIAGMRRRVLEPPAPGTYGAVARALMRKARAAR